MEESGWVIKSRAEETGAVGIRGKNMLYLNTAVIAGEPAGGKHGMKGTTIWR